VALEDAIYNNRGQAPLELAIFQYRKLFGLSATQIANEPTDQLFLNLKIYAYIKDKERLEAKNGNS
tara:strand:- start:846 stop:1043 length:198 start_codon:yes stop_codon:yes gene_type:complete